MKRPPGEADDAELFRREMRDVTPAPSPNRAAHRLTPPPPVPVKRLEDEPLVLEELARLAGGDDDVEMEEDHAYLRPELPRDVLRKLRAAHWVVQDEIDLHGLTGDEAALATRLSSPTAASPQDRSARVAGVSGVPWPER